MGTSCADLLADLSLNLYESYFIYELLENHAKKQALYFIFISRYKDDVVSLINSKIRDYVERNYPIKLGIKDTTDTVKYA